jgi:hypothetical protein
VGRGGELLRARGGQEGRAGRHGWGTSAAAGRQAWRPTARACHAAQSHQPSPPRLPPRSRPIQRPPQPQPHPKSHPPTDVDHAALRLAAAADLGHELVLGGVRVVIVADQHVAVVGQPKVEQPRDRLADRARRLHVVVQQHHLAGGGRADVDRARDRGARVRGGLVLGNGVDHVVVAVGGVGLDRQQVPPQGLHAVGLGHVEHAARRGAQVGARAHVGALRHVAADADCLATGDRVAGRHVPLGRVGARVDADEGAARALALRKRARDGDALPARRAACRQDRHVAGLLRRRAARAADGVALGHDGAVLQAGLGDGACLGNDKDVAAAAVLAVRGRVGLGGRKLGHRVGLGAHLDLVGGVGRDADRLGRRGAADLGAVDAERGVTLGGVGHR